MMAATAWVLLWMWGTNMGFAVSDIASKEACEDLARRMTVAYTSGSPSHSCFEYQLAQRKP